MNGLDRDLAGATAAHRRLEHSLADLTDAEARGPSLLPDWTVGHVVTHLARNADSHVRMLTAAARGESTEQYPGGMPQRAADIEAGAHRTAAELVHDLAAAHERLEAAWADMPAAGWGGTGVSAIGPVSIDDLPFRRWRETCVHHADLGREYRYTDWPAEYVRLELQRMTMLWDSRQPMGLTGLPPAALAADPRRRLAWLLGRATIDTLPPAGLMA